ncbi:MAG: TetR/AcrR family transcriptional regulator, partial [Methanospirillum sp.]|nr:TetR/AcrR family transcriptional regulator [Methanospirillum sp.]
MPRIIETSKEEYREEARKRIICAAITIMKRRGYRALTVEEVAKEVGVTKGTLYLYFENKEDLLNHVFRESVRVFEVIIRDSADVISGDNDLNTVLEHIITHSLGLQKIYGSMNDNIAFVTEFVSHAIRDPDIYTKFQQAFVDYIQVFEDWLRLLEKEELIRDGMDIRGTA